MARRKIISDDAALDAAADVMAARGPFDFTLADVAAAAGIAPATLMQRFGDKGGLTLAARRRENERFARTLAALPSASGAAAVIAVLRLMTPDIDEASLLAPHVLWMGQDMAETGLNALARERSRLLRAAIATRLPPLPMATDQASVLVEAQWRGALAQWGMAPEGRLVDFVTGSLAAWFILAQGGGRRR